MDILILLALVVVNGLLSMSEIALIASSRVRLEQAAARGGKRAKAALKLAQAPTQFLSTVQIGITLVGILSGAFGEAALGTDLIRWLERFDATRAHAAEIATAVLVLGVTYVSLVVGELLPKRIAMSRPEAIAEATAIPMTWLSRLTSPFVAFLTASTGAILWIFRFKAGAAAEVSEDEVRGMIKKGVETGVFHQTEQTLIHRVLDLGGLGVRSIMVPRPNILWIDETESAAGAMAIMRASPRSHFPICRGGLDNPVGFVHIKDVLAKVDPASTFDVNAIRRPCVFVPETIQAIDLLNMFEASKTHIAFVVDEYGNVVGLATLNDVVTALIGRVVRPSVEAPLEVRRDDGSWLLDGMLPIRRLREIMGLGTEELPDGNFETIAGLVITEMGKIPKTGEHFVWRGFRFEVVDMDEGRVDKLLLSKMPTAADAGA